MSYSNKNQRHKKSNNTNSYFKIGTFNMWGLTETIKQEQLVQDTEKYGADVICIQETKISKVMYGMKRGLRSPLSNQVPPPIYVFPVIQSSKVSPFSLSIS